MTDDNSNGLDQATVRPGVRSMMRPGVVRVLGQMGPRPARSPSFVPWRGTSAGERVIPDADLPTEYVEGFLDVTPDGHGYLRPKMIPSSKDVYISSSQVRRFNLRPGDMVGGQAREPKESERYWGLLKVEKVNGVSSEKAGERPSFDALTAVFPDEQIILETEAEPLSTRIIDLIAPIGKGQRGLIVAQPKAGKTWLLRDIAQALSKNHPKMHLIAVLIGERPEEVTEVTRNLKGEVAASHFDEQPLEQVRIAELALERAKRFFASGSLASILLASSFSFAPLISGY